MKKKLHLVAFTIQKDFEIYRQNKNVDSILLLLKRYQKFLDLCFRQIADILLNRTFYDHVIYLKKNKQLLVFVLYDMSYNETLELHRYLDENLNKEFIRVNHFDAIVSVLFVKKLEEDFRFCVDYRDLNVVIVKNRYFLSLIFEILNRFN